MSSMVTVAVLQCSLADDRETNVDRVVALIEQAAADGANVILAPELFEGAYFPRTEDPADFARAQALDGDNRTLARLQALAKAHRVVLPYSFFEKAGPAYYNSLAMIDADGAVLGVYRKSHIPDGPGYEEKFFFRPGDTGFRVWSTHFGRVGVGICWDQWFPEAARAMALLGAELLLYPTAIGSEPEEPDVDTKDPWQRVMIGHAVANSVPVAAANRIGDEHGQVFYGSSFLCDPRGDKVAELGRDDTGVAMHRFDREDLARRQAAWGFFRDRRPELYRVLLSADGVEPE